MYLLSFLRRVMLFLLFVFCAGSSNIVTYVDTEIN